MKTNGIPWDSFNKHFIMNTKKEDILYIFLTNNQKIKIKNK